MPRPWRSDHYPAVAALKMDKPVVYSLGYGGHFDECATVFYSASVLVSKFGGTAFEPQDGVIMNAKELLQVADQCRDLASEPPAFPHGLTPHR